MSRTVLRQRGRAPAFDPRSIAGARRTAYPGFVEPCHPTLRDRAPLEAEWIHEIKSDGYRVQVHVRDGGVTVYSRESLNWTRQYPTLAQAAAQLPVRSLILDGEAVVLGNGGAADLQALRRELGNRNSDRLLCYAFDLLYLDGFDLREAALVERKRLLRDLLARAAPGPLVYVEHLEGGGDVVFRHACRIGAEGIVAKRRDAPYRSGRQETWVKLKCVKSDTFPIVAFVEKLGARPRKIASLYLGRHDARGRLLYAGKARSGYTESMARELRERLDPLIVAESPLAEPVHKPKATWVRPVVPAEIQYSSFTDDGLIREAVFKGVRDDLAPDAEKWAPVAGRRSGSGSTPARDGDGKKNHAAPMVPAVRAPRIVPGRPKAVHIGVPRENILQLLPDAVVPSKEELAAYWRRVWKRALPHLGRRPLKLVRHTHATTFYHKGPLPPVPPAVHTLTIAKREGGEGTRLWVDDLEGLLGLVRIGAVELHPWNALIDDIEHPDRLVFDLDPGAGVAWDFVVDTALRLRAMLREEGLDSRPKLTGGKGLHLMVPLARRITHDAARDHARRIAQRLLAEAPGRYTVSAAPDKRAGRIFIDYLRNGRGNTAIGAWSPRALEGFPVAAPVTWREVEAGIRPGAFTMAKPPRK